MNFKKLRMQMVEEQLQNRGISDERLLKAMRTVPREEFFPEEDRNNAYYDGAMPIGYGQTISQPYMVARMVELLELQEDDIVLEVGCGSGYQAAILAELAQEVYSIEIVPELVEYAADNLQRCGYKNVTVIEGDGSRGLPDKAPFDTIIVAAAAHRIPAALENQLAEDGRMLLPVGAPGFQVTTRVTKKNDKIEEEQFDGCVYVPLLGDY